MCSNCRQLGHVAEECNARSTHYSPFKRYYKENEAKLPPSNSKDVDCIIQHIPLDQDVFATRVQTWFTKVIGESNNASDFDINIQGLKKRKHVTFNHLITLDDSKLLKLNHQLSTQTMSNPQIPSNLLSLLRNQQKNTKIMFQIENKIMFQ